MKAPSTEQLQNLKLWLELALLLLLVPLVFYNLTKDHTRAAILGLNVK
jgi:hypothetical protein